LSIVTFVVIFLKHRRDVEIGDAVGSPYVSDSKLDDFAEPHPRVETDQRYPKARRDARHERAWLFPVVWRFATGIDRSMEELLELLHAEWASSGGFLATLALALNEQSIDRVWDILLAVLSPTEEFADHHQLVVQRINV